MHDLLLGFAKRQIGAFQEIRETATSRQAAYLGELRTLRAHADESAGYSGFSPLIALWGSLEELSGDKALVSNTYKAALAGFEPTEKMATVADNYHIAARLLELKVG